MHKTYPYMPLLKEESLLFPLLLKDVAYISIGQNTVKRKKNSIVVAEGEG